MESEAAAPIVSEGGFSLFGLLMDADIVVKLVLIILLIASLWSWAVIIEKSFTVSRARRRAKAFEDAFWSGRADDLDRRGAASGSDAASRIYASITREWTDARRAPESEGHMMMIDRAERSLRAGVDREVGRVSNGLGVLATIGSASPFIGLFGTVWGIMNAFLNIAGKQDTSLTHVGGPIALCGSPRRRSSQCPTATQNRPTAPSTRRRPPLAPTGESYLVVLPVPARVRR